MKNKDRNSLPVNLTQHLIKADKPLARKPFTDHAGELNPQVFPDTVTESNRS